MSKPTNRKQVKRILELRNKKGLSFRAISKLLGKSVSTVFEQYTIYHNNPSVLDIRKLKSYTEVPSSWKANSEYIRLEKGLSGIDFIRELVRGRDKHTCQVCFKKWKKGQRKFDVHHLDKKYEGKRSYKLDKQLLKRMITLCHQCHLNLKSVREKMVMARKIRSELSTG